MKIITVDRLADFKAKLDEENKSRYVEAASADDDTIVIGTKEATSGLTIEVPWIEVNADGLVVDYGYHTHTVFSTDSDGNLLIE